MSNNIKITNGQTVNLTATEQKTTTISLLGLKSVGTSDAHYVHKQTTASASWTINHPLNKKPSVTVVDSADRNVIGQIEYINNNSLTITFKSAFKGEAYLN